MPYSDFTLARIKTQFGITNQRASLFNNIEPVAPSEKLQFDLDEASHLLVRSEKAKSEWIVAPILREVRAESGRYLTIYSGEFLDVDSEKGLNGECDFILAKDINTYDINYPIVQLVEAKRGEIEAGIPQCAAQMVGAMFFNKRNETPVDRLYGCVTTGLVWQFMQLENGVLSIDETVYALTDVDILLGVFSQIIRYYKQTLI